MDHLRQQDILDPKMLIWPITMIGLGGIGSAAAQTLAKLGVGEFRLWDPDTIEPHNVPNQMLFDERHLGQAKVAVVREYVTRMGASVTRCEQQRFDPGHALDGIVVCGVDSMTSRASIWEAVKWNSAVPLFFDGRLGGENLQIFTINPTDLDDVEFYEQHLFPSSEAAKLPCTAQSIVHPAAILAGFIAALLTRWTRGEEHPRRMVFDSVTMTLMTTN